MLEKLFGRKELRTPRVRLMGMSERGLNLFTMFLSGPAKGLCEVVDDGSHEIVIVDVDAPDNARLWMDMRREFHGPAIVLSVGKRDLSNAFWVSKPVQFEQFKLALEQAKLAVAESAAKLTVEKEPPLKPKAPELAQAREVSPVAAAKSSAVSVRQTAEPETPLTAAAASGMNESMEERSQNCCGDLADEAYLDPSQRDRLFGDCSGGLLGLMREAMRMTADGGVVSFEGLSARELYVSAAEDFVSTTMPEAFIRSLCVRSESSYPVKLVQVDKTPAQIGASEDQRLRRLDNMLWKVALWTSRGRVDAGVSLDAPVRLRAWPNIPRLMTVPHGLRIAALWVGQPTGLLETARKLAVPHRFVFSFYCACKAFDLVEQLGAGGHSKASASPTQVAAKTMTQEKRGLFGGLLKKLGF